MNRVFPLAIPTAASGLMAEAATARRRFRLACAEYRQTWKKNVGPSISKTSSIAEWLECQPAMSRPCCVILIVWWGARFPR
jgi:hypothetical protein